MIRINNLSTIYKELVYIQAESSHLLILITVVGFAKTAILVHPELYKQCRSICMDGLIII